MVAEISFSIQPHLPSNNNNNNNAFVERHNAVAPEALGEQLASYKQCSTNEFLA